MITKKEILNIPNSVLMSAMYATLVNVQHTHLNPHKQADFDPLYIIKILKNVMFVDIDAALGLISEEEHADIDKAQRRYVNNANELNKHLQIITEMYTEKTAKLNELALIKDEFYNVLNEFLAEIKLSPEVVVNLETNSYYNYLRFDKNEAWVCDHLPIYNETLVNNLKEFKALVEKSLEEEATPKAE